MSDRKEDLISIIKKSGPDNYIKAMQLIEETIFLEEQLIELKELPFIQVSKKNPAIQKTTPAAKQYKEFLQQYNNCLRILFRMTGEMEENDEESPLRKWAREHRHD